MDESHLFKLALFVSIIGLLALYAITRIVEINDTTIDKITGSNNEEQIKVTGNVEKITYGNGITIIDVSQQNIVQVYLFDNKENFSTGKEITVVGKKQDGKIIVNSALQR